MTTPSPCPPESALLAFHEGSLQDADIDSVAAHLAECPTCEADLTRIENEPHALYDAFRPLRKELLSADAVPTRCGRYELGGQIGRGGMGIVYKGWNPKLRRFAAVKLLRSPDGQNGAARFRREAEILARLRHPNLVPVYDIGGEGDSVYLAMEYVGGGTLAERLKNGPLAPHGAAKLIREVARAVEAANLCGVIHRDINPSNILLSEENPPVPKLADFGLALPDETGDRLTETGLMAGTPGYMAPEQVDARFGSIGTATDVYGLGAVLYEALTGNPLFTGRNVLEIVRQVTDVDPASARTINPKVPRDLSVICERCLRRQPGERYASAGSLAEDLDRFLKQEPVQARPVSSAEALWKWARRRPLAAGQAAVLLATILTGLVVTTVLWQKAAHAERIAKVEANNALTESDTANAINEFLVNDLLDQANPEKREMQVKDVTLRSVVDRAAKNITGRFEGRPIVEAGVRQAIGNAYRALGEYSLAEPHLKAARALCETHRGPDHPETLNTLVSLGRYYQDIKENGKAVELIERAYDGRKRVLGEDHRDTFSLLTTLGGIHYDLQHLDIAEEILTRAVAQAQNNLGNENKTTLVAMNNLGALYYSRKRYGDSASMRGEALAISRKILGDDHPTTLSLMNNLALDHVQLKQFDSAGSLMEEVLRRKTLLYGPDSPTTLLSQNTLALFHYERDHFARAEELYRATFASRSRLFGTDHPQTLVTKTNLAHTLVRRENEKEAVVLFREVADARIRHPDWGPDHVSTKAVLFSLAGCLLVEKRFSEAVVAAEQNAASERKAGASTRAMSRSLLLLATAYAHMGQYARAETAAKEAIDILQKLAPDEWDMHYARAILGASLWGQGNVKAGEPLLVNENRSLESNEKAIPEKTVMRKVFLVSTKRLLVTLIETNAQSSKADPYR